MKKKWIAVIIISGLIISSIGLYGKGFFKVQEQDLEIKQYRSTKEGSLSLKENESNDEEYIPSDRQGDVDIAVSFQNLIEEHEEELVFKVYLNTHSVDLEGIDYNDIAVLETETGLEIKDGFIWEAGQGDGHHLYKILKLPIEYNGNKLISDSTQYIKLIIAGINGEGTSEFIWNKEDLEAVK